MSMLHPKVKLFLSKGFSRNFIIGNHVSGFRVTVRDSDYGEVTFSTGNDVETLMLDCIKQFDNSVKIKEAEKVKRLARRKKEIQKELEEVSTELANITLNTFQK